jgi:SRSO17 transposase
MGLPAFKPQVAASLSLATDRGRVPAKITFATKPEIAVTKMWAVLASGVPSGVVLADTGYDDEAVPSESVTALGLPYEEGIRPATTVWARGIEPLPPKTWSGSGTKPKLLRRQPCHEPIAVKTLVMYLPTDHYQTVTRCDGRNAGLAFRFTGLRVRPARQSHLATRMHLDVWQLIEWPQGGAEPAGFWLATARPDATLEQLIFVAKMRWRIERDYRVLKQEYGLSCYECGKRRSFLSRCHHVHRYVCLLTVRRLTHNDRGRAVLNQKFALHTDHFPRGRLASAAPRARTDDDTSLRRCGVHRQQTSSVSVLEPVRQV